MKERIADIKNILNRSEKRKFVTLIFSNALLSLADIASIAFVFIILSIYNGQSPGWLKPVLQKLNIESHSLTPATILIIVFVIKNIVGYFTIKAQSRYIADIATRLSTKNLLLYLEGSYEDYVNIDASVWMRRICFQAQEFSQYVLSSIQQIINEVILIIITIVALAFYNAKVLLIVSLILLPAVIILSYITKKRLKNTRENIKSSNEILLQYLNESISGFVESNIYDKNEFFTDRYKKSQFILSRFVADMQVTQQMPARFFETFAVLGLFIFIAVINLNSSVNNSSIFMLGAFIAAAYKIIPGISKIINYASQVNTYSFTTDEIKKAAFTQLVVKSTSVRNIEKIELRGIHFSYIDHPIFSGFNCIISRGNFIGINGASGKGKTTLIDIMLGFLTPISGRIFYNDEEIDSNVVKKYWPQIAYVKQTSYLLHDSILNNIILFENNYDKQRLNTVIQVTGLKNWLTELNGGINTIVAADGKNISGGQKQRIAIARALYKDAAVVILDEPFNELDEASEISMLHYFKQASQEGKIIILITHNVQSFSFCNSVITLD